MSIRQNSLEIVSPPSSPSNDELRMRRRMEKLKEEANAAAERYKAVKASGAKEESKGAYQDYPARVDDYRRARKEYESSFGTGDVEMGEVPEAGGVSMVSKPSTVAGTKSVDVSLEKGKTSVKTVEGS